jgi:hypothetical protein
MDVGPLDVDEPDRPKTFGWEEGDALGTDPARLAAGRRRLLATPRTESRGRSRGRGVCRAVADGPERESAVVRLSKVMAQSRRSRRLNTS